MRKTFRAGGIGIELSLDDPRVHFAFAPPFSDFLEAPDTSADLVLDVVRGEPLPDRGALLFDSGEVWALYENGPDLALECHSDLLSQGPYKTAIVDRSLSHGRVIMHTDTVLNPLEFPLDEVLTNMLLARLGGVELHGCGVIDGSDGYLFVGQSGAGKTTTARLWTDAIVLSDDRIIIREHPAGMRLFGTPWHGEAALSTPGDAPLRAIYLLVQSTANSIVPLGRAEAMARLLTCAFPPYHDPAAVLSVVDFLARLVDAIPVCELRFVPDQSAVALVRAATR